ncbi:MAG TPA: Ig-like domain-containing protein [Spirochaetia bacterium]|nr:Ig-like domain-containing protein [Spirochaetia bacterium]
MAVRIPRRCLESALLAILVPFGCAPVADIRTAVVGDVRPPELISVTAAAPTKVRFTFDEPVIVDAKRLFVSPVVGTEVPQEAAPTVDIDLTLPLDRGKRYQFEGFAADRWGNGLGFIVPVYGFNPEVPRMVINEFITEGADKHPDIIELAVLSDGNLAGACLYVGTPQNWEFRLVLPEVTVRSGDFVLIHCKPQGISAEIDELSDPAGSGGYDASPVAWDFWLPEGTGLSATNGVLALASSPDGTLLDAVVYSNRTSESDDRYRGFGSTDMMERVDEIVARGAWIVAGEQARPEDAVDPTASTPTRSICRNSNSTDTDAKQDWHITPTSGATFGTTNSDGVYVQ